MYENYIWRFQILLVWLIYYDTATGYSFTVVKCVKNSFVSFQVAGWKLHTKSKILIAVYFLASCAMPVYIFFTYSSEPKTVGIICTRTPGTQEIFDAFNISIKRTFSTIVLGFIIFVLSFLMANELYKQRRARKQMTMGAEAGNGDNKSGVGAQGRSDKEKQIAVMMYIISLIFLVTKIPYMIGQYTRTYGYRKVNVDVFIFLNDSMPVTTAINYINFFVNFFVYYYYMSSFRQKFKHIFCCKEPESKYSSGLSTRISTSMSSVSKCGESNKGSEVSLKI